MYNWVREFFSTATLVLINTGAVGAGIWLIKDIYSDFKIKHREQDARIKILETKAAQSEVQDKHNAETFTRIDKNIQIITEHLIQKK